MSIQNVATKKGIPIKFYLSGKNSRRVTNFIKNLLIHVRVILYVHKVVEALRWASWWIR
jgi:hypothetical protein